MLPTLPHHTRHQRQDTTRITHPFSTPLMQERQQRKQSIHTTHARTPLALACHPRQHATHVIQASMPPMPTTLARHSQNHPSHATHTIITLTLARIARYFSDSFVYVFLCNIVLFNQFLYCVIILILLVSTFLYIISSFVPYGYVSIESFD